MAKITYADDIVKQRGLQVRAFEFRCPFCGRSFERGGKKEGFVKAGASRHVYQCWELLLYLAGWTPSVYYRKGMAVMPIEKAHPRRVRNLKAALRKRARDGELPQLLRQLPKSAYSPALSGSAGT